MTLFFDLNCIGKNTKSSWYRGVVLIVENTRREHDGEWEGQQWAEKIHCWCTTKCGERMTTVDSMLTITIRQQNTYSVYCTVVWSTKNLRVTFFSGVTL